ncbi:MAG TPA: PQQ-dependent dehydrogenase, methanol/ethanol family [Candidatus Limnocylindrales bacterium]|nr:PQQ-dependent dehydrogenase, methanol/ethanol family [Candidatus Limnocylindrales bacterium]
MIRRHSSSLLNLLCFLYLLSFSATAFAQVTNDQLLHSSETPASWLQYAGSYDAHRFSSLSQINRENVSHLTTQWLFQTSTPGPFENTPLVVDGIMYVTAPENLAFALDARTGRRLWTYKRALPEKIRACCGHVNRGLAMLGSRLFMSTLDAHVVALDATTGNVLWDVQAADYARGYAFTVAPLVIKDKVIVGVSGGEYGIRGFIDAYDAATGKRAWRFYTIPAPGEPGGDSWGSPDAAAHGGAPAWVTGTYDPQLNLLYWPTGNPSPSDDGSGRKGDNLYSNSILALNPDSGKLQWYFQFTPFDLHDWDATEVPVLLDADLDGKPRKLLLHANRNGFFYVLDRTNGKFIFAKPFATQTWAQGMDSSGKPILLHTAEPGESEGVRTCPGAGGATNWMAPSYSPQTGMLYVSIREQCDVFYTHPQQYVAGRLFLGSMYVPATKEKDWGAVRAIDPKTGEVRWEYKEFSATWAGNLSTAGHLVFTGDLEGNFIALDADTGKHLWHIQTGAAIYAAPITYELNGLQFVAISSGTTLLTFALPEAQP